MDYVQCYLFNNIYSLEFILIKFLRKQILFVVSIVILLTAINQDVPQLILMNDSYISDERIDRRFEKIVEKEKLTSKADISGEDKNFNNIRDDVERVFYYVFYKDEDKNLYFTKEFTDSVLLFLKKSNDFSKLEKTYKKYDLSKSELEMMEIFWKEKMNLKNDFMCIYENDLKNNKYLRENFLKVIFKMLDTEERRDHFGRYMLLKEDNFFRFLDKNRDYSFYLKNEWTKNIDKGKC